MDNNYINRLIAIDTEYHTNQFDIDKVFCVAACNAVGKTFVKWCGNGEPCTLREVASYLNIENPIFVAHCFEIAERSAFIYLGDDPDKYDWLCTLRAERLIRNAFAEPKYSLGLSLADLVKRYRNIEIDCEHKEMMRQLCINNNTTGSENQIMDYCLSDTVHLIPIIRTQLEAFERVLGESIQLTRGKGFVENLDALGLMLWQMDSVKAFCKFSQYGFPINRERVKYIRLGARATMDKLRAEFNNKYPGVFVQKAEAAKLESFCLDNNNLNIKVSSWTCSQNEVQRRIGELVKRCDIKEYPKTDTGLYKTDSKTLKDYFDRQDNFGADFLWLNNVLNQLKGIAGSGKTDWLANIDNNRLRYGSLNPFGSKTGRCQPQGSKGFILSWTKFLYGIIDPPENKWIVELDYTAEETAIQAAITQDSAYLDVYNSKDTYLWFMYKLGMIPANDYETLSKSELKKKYGELRQKMKVFVLAQGYGAGANKLARIAGFTETQAREIQTKIDTQLFKKAYQWKQKFIDIAISKSRGVALPDGWICRSAFHSGIDASKPTHTSIQNWPFQAYGGYILRCIAKEIVNIKTITPIATMHDAVMFMVDAGDYASIEAVKKIMIETANKCLCVDTPIIKVGEPEIIKHGEPWTPEHEFDKDFFDILEAGRKVEGVKEYK